MKRGAALPYVRTAHRLLPTGTVYDFVPLQPRAPATLATLLTGGAVDGEIRVLPAREPTSSPAAADDDDADEWRVVGHTALSAEAVESLVRSTEANPPLPLTLTLALALTLALTRTRCASAPRSPRACASPC